MKGKLIAILACGSVLFSGSVSADSSVETSSIRVARCQEDDPCWDCRTMGNQICGQWNNDTNVIELVHYPEREVVGIRYPLASGGYGPIVTTLPETK